MKKIIAVCSAFVFLLASCSEANKPGKDATTEVISPAPTSSPPVGQKEEKAPETSEELLSALLTAWEDGNVSDFYDYLSEDMLSLLDEEAFVGVFDNLTDSFGKISDFGDYEKKETDGFDVFSFRADFENAYSDVTVSIKDLKIAGITHDDRITETFEIERKNGVTERYFLLQSGEYELNAVYTFKDKGPSVLLIPGSGPQDCNETIGILTPFRDLAVGLAENGVNSLRLEKRTYRYNDKITEADGIGEEYVADYSVALEWVRTQEESECVFLLGHSLGGQIAVEMSKKNDIKGIILWSSTPRHLAEISADQFSSLDKDNESVYRLYEGKAKQATDENAEGLYYFGASDHYWASYNLLDTIGTLESSDIPCLILNSSADMQVFPDDIEKWRGLAEQRDDTVLKVYDEYSHFGYKIDMTDPSAVYRHTDFPDEIVEDIVKFVLNN